MIHILIKFLSFNFIEKIILFEVYHYLGLKLIFIRPSNLLFNGLIARFMFIFVFFLFVKYIFIIKDLIFHVLPLIKFVFFLFVKYIFIIKNLIFHVLPLIKFVFFLFVKYIFIIKDLICLFGSNLPIILIYHFLIVGSLIVNKVYYFFQINL